MGERYSNTVKMGHVNRTSYLCKLFPSFVPAVRPNTENEKRRFVADFVGVCLLPFVTRMVLTFEIVRHPQHFFLNFLFWMI